MKTIAILITLLLIININIYQGNSTEENRILCIFALYCGVEANLITKITPCFGDLL
jgi:hypothetical protein